MILAIITAYSAVITACGWNGRVAAAQSVCAVGSALALGWSERNWTFLRAGPKVSRRCSWRERDGEAGRFCAATWRTCTEAFRTRARPDRSALIRWSPQAGDTPEEWVADGGRVLADLGYEGESDTMTVAVKKPKDGELTDEQTTANTTHNSRRAVAERGNSLLDLSVSTVTCRQLHPAG